MTRPLSQPAVAVVVLNYKNRDDTLKCVLSVLDSTWSDFQVVVVDNCSGDDCLSHVRTGVAAHARQALVQYVQSPDNRGYGPGNNQGIAHAKANGGTDYYWILNNDCTVAPSAMAELVAVAQAKPDAGVVGCTICYAEDGRRDVVQARAGSRMDPWTCISTHIGNGERWSADLSDSEVARVEAQLSFVSGASMFVSRRFVDEVGLMSEDYFLYFEEADWIARAGKRFGMAYAAKARVFHAEGATIGSGSGQRKASPFSVYWIIRSRVRFAARHRPHVLAVVYLRALRYALAEAIKGDRLIAMAICRALLGKDFRK